MLGPGDVEQNMIRRRQMNILRCSEGDMEEGWKGNCCDTYVAPRSPFRQTFLFDQSTTVQPSFAHIISHLESVLWGEAKFPGELIGNIGKIFDGSVGWAAADSHLRFSSFS